MHSDIVKKEEEKTRLGYEIIRFDENDSKQVPDMKIMASGLL